MQTGYIISVVLNLLSFVLMIVGMIMMMISAHKDEYLQGNGLNALKYFTIQSNLLYGLYAGVFAAAELIYGSAETIPSVFYILKYIFTVGVTVTLLTVMCFLAPFVRKSLIAMLRGANLFFHLFIPVFGIVSFCCFEKGAQISVWQVFLGLIPYILYSVYYSVNALSHAENGQVSEEYDWYRFLAKGTGKAAVVMSVMLAAVTAVCFGLWFINSL